MGHHFVLVGHPILTSFVREEYHAYPFCAHDDSLDSLSRIADGDTGSQMTFPDAVSMDNQIRMQLESRGLKFEDAIVAQYEPI